MKIIRFQLWKRKDGTEWTCAEEGKAHPYNAKGEALDVYDKPMKLMWEFDINPDDFDGNMEHVRRAANVAQYAYHAGHFRWPVEQKLNSKARAYEKQVQRDRDARRLAAGEVTAEELQDENSAFGFPASRVVIHFPKKEK